MDDLEIEVISLPNATARRDYMTRVLGENRGLAWSFFDALTPDAHVPSLTVDANRQIDRYGRPLGAGEIGCFKSHYCVMRDFLDRSPKQWLLVLEDDVWLDTNFDLAEVTEYADRNGINYIRLFAKTYRKADLVGSISNFRNIVRFHSDPYGTQAYLINKEGARRFLKDLAYIDLPIDDELGRFWRHGLDAYCVFPFPVVERSVASSLSMLRDDVPRARTLSRRQLLAYRSTEKVRKTLHNLAFKMGNRAG